MMKKSLQVVLVANSLPALNDVTAMEVPDIVAEAAKVCLLMGKKTLTVTHLILQFHISH